MSAGSARLRADMFSFVTLEVHMELNVLINYHPSLFAVILSIWISSNAVNTLSDANVYCHVVCNSHLSLNQHFTCSDTFTVCML